MLSSGPQAPDKPTIVRGCWSLYEYAWPSDHEQPHPTVSSNDTRMHNLLGVAGRPLLIRARERPLHAAPRVRAVLPRQVATPAVQRFR